MPTAGAMISPGGSDGPSCTVTMPIVSTAIWWSGLQRVGRRDRAADDDRVEAVDLLQLVLPADQGLELALALELQAVDRVLGDDDEQGEVDRVDALAQDGPLPAALADVRLAALDPGVAEQERVGVLEVVAVDDAAERLARRQRLAVAGVDVADLPLRARSRGRPCGCGIARARGRSGGRRAGGRPGSRPRPPAR